MRDRLLARSLLLALVLPTAAFALERPIVAGCGDGSVVFAAKWEDVHCAGAVRMTRGRVPGVGAVPDPTPHVSPREVARERALEREIAAVVPSAGGAPIGSADVMLPTAEHRALRDLVVLGRAPASAGLAYRRDGARPARIDVAYSRDLDERVRATFEQVGIPLAGPVLAFRLDAGPSTPVPAFAQGGVTHRPDPRDVRELGWVREIGAAPATGPRLGYAVLPAGFDVTRPLVLFWGDAVAATPAWGDSSKAR